MNRTLNINIGGRVFHIDSDAYKQLQDYISALRAHFMGKEGEEEIITDIELRIAELLSEYMEFEVREVVNVADIERLITTLGTPDMMEEEDEFEKEEEAPERPKKERTKRTRTSGTKKKHIFRDTENGVIGGVCAGLANYLNVDPLWLRIAFIIAVITAGTGILFYCILWAIIPEAKTRAEKMQMRGEHINIANIEKAIREELDNLQNMFSDFKGSKKKTTKKRAKRPEPNRYHATEVPPQNTWAPKVTNPIKRFFKVIGKIVAGGVSLMGSIFITILVCIIALLLFFPEQEFSDQSPFGAIHFANYVFTSDWHEVMAVLGIGLLIFTPLFGITYSGIKFLFDSKQNSKVTAFVLTGFWVIGMAFLMIAVAPVGSDISESDKITRDYIINQDYMHVKSIHADIPKSNYYNSVMYVRNDSVYDTDIRLNIRYTKESSAKLTVTRSAHGKPYSRAVKRAENISFPFDTINNTLLVPSYFRYSTDDLIRGQDVSITLHMPEGMSIYLDQNIAYHLGRVKTACDISRYQMVENTWIMTSKGLKCLDCQDHRDCNHESVTNSDKQPVNREI